mmetsp:Transcript_7649/g.27281  ORF Transcript_7649/g.27281 Transcript_7649/m.27281 type:complete len:307 (-) Transcript_7649:1014-1934(-)
MERASTAWEPTYHDGRRRPPRRRSSRVRPTTAKDVLVDRVRCHTHHLLECHVRRMAGSTPWIRREVRTRHRTRMGRRKQRSNRRVVARHLCHGAQRNGSRKENGRRMGGTQGVQGRLRRRQPALGGSCSGVLHRPSVRWNQPLERERSARGARDGVDHVLRVVLVPVSIHLQHTRGCGRRQTKSALVGNGDHPHYKTSPNGRTTHLVHCPYNLDRQQLHGGHLRSSYGTPSLRMLAWRQEVGGTLRLGVHGSKGENQHRAIRSDHQRQAEAARRLLQRIPGRTLLCSACLHLGSLLGPPPHAGRKL